MTLIKESYVAVSISDIRNSDLRGAQMDYVNALSRGFMDNEKNK